MLRCGRIKYTNDLPIYAAFDAGAIEYPGTLHADVPARLNAMLLRGELDMSPISAFAWAANSERARAAAGPVHRRARRGRFGRARLATAAGAARTARRSSSREESASGRYLLRIILERRYRRARRHTSTRANRSRARVRRRTDAADRRRARSTRSNAFPAEIVYDLGRLWHEWSGHQTVFAVWAARRDAYERDPGAVSRLHARADRRVHVVALARARRRRARAAHDPRAPRDSTRATSGSSTSCSTSPRATAWPRIAASWSQIGAIPRVPGAAAGGRRCPRWLVCSTAPPAAAASTFDEGLRLYNEARPPRARRRRARAPHADASARRRDVRDRHDDQLHERLQRALHVLRLLPARAAQRRLHDVARPGAGSREVRGRSGRDADHDSGRRQSGAGHRLVRSALRARARASIRTSTFTRSPSRRSSASRTSRTSRRATCSRA